LQFASAVGNLCWSFTTTRTWPLRWIEFRKGNETLLLACINNPASFRQTESGSATEILLHWIIEHEQLIYALNHLLEEPWLPEREFGMVTRCPSDCIALGWKLETRTETLSGTLIISQERGWRLLHQHPWQTELPVDLRFQDQLTIRFGLSLSLPALPMDRLRTVMAGDILVCGSRSQLATALRLQTSKIPSTWSTSLTGQSLRVMHRIREDTNMTALNSAEFATGIEQMPVKLTLKLGELDLSLAEVRQLQTGYIIELPFRLDDCRVEILAQNIPIGQGDLVVIGDVLGVRLLSRVPNGDQ
jgi:type III secretion system YscQ/HrcQ family protein